MPEFSSGFINWEQIINWGNDTFITAHFSQDRNIVKHIREGNLHILLHKNGIRISAPLQKADIHFSQIIDIKESTESELIQVNKSVIGGAVVGSLIFGPFGAIIGGMSGMGSKNKKKDSHLLIISYWDVCTRQPLSIIFDTVKTVTPFVKRYEKESKSA
jgi:hypothetical protein